MISRKRPLFISGISPGPTGTGRLLEFIEQSSDEQGGKVDFIYGPLGLPSHKEAFAQGRWGEALRLVWRKVLGKIRMRVLVPLVQILGRDRTLVIFHFQSIGFARVERLLANHRGKIYAYLVDNNFFCLRSYNHLPGTNDSCLACLNSDFSAAKKNNCPSQPFPEADALGFLERLRALVREGRIGVLTQNAEHQRLAETHFGPQADVSLVGDWMSDWETPPPPLSKEGGRSIAYDVVFHGAPEPAKGNLWALALARAMPSRRFLFPFSAISLPQGETLPENADFKAMNWNSGLGAHCQSAQAVLVPSLSSSPVEGALLKSIRWARLSVVVDVEGAFSQEISDDLLLRLPKDPKAAASVFEARLASGWKPEEKSRRTWFENYRRENIRVLNQILGAIEK